MSTILIPEQPLIVPPKIPNSRLNFLDGLRAIAALWVVVSHIWITQFGIHAHQGALGLWTNWLLYSHLSVDAFIVLSGFCLILPVMKNGSLKGGMWTFFIRRARRILPPCYHALGLSMLLAAIVSRIDSGRWYLDHQAVWVNLFLLQDIFLRWNIFNSPLWSVAIEWRIYFLFPVIVWGLRRWGQWSVLITAALLGYSLTALVFWKFPDKLMACPWYLLLFAMGVCAGSVAFRPHKMLTRNISYGLSFAFLLALCFLLLAYPVTSYDGKVFGRHMPLIDAIAGAMIALFLVGLSRDQKDLRLSRHFAFLSWSPLVVIGQFSYSLYLTHMPLLLIFNRLLHLPRMHTTPLQNVGLLMTFGLPALLGFAYLFFLVSERPFLKAKPA